jgi:hypothetical protein
MKRNYVNSWIMVCVLLLGLFFSAFAQETNGPADTDSPPALDPGIPSLPEARDPKEVAALLIVSVITTLLTAAVGKIQKLPRPVLPILSPALGFLIGVGISWAEGLPWWTPGLTAIAGAAGVGWREIINQNLTKRLKPLELSKTKARPIDSAVALNENLPTIPTRKEAREIQSARAENGINITPKPPAP